MTPRHPLPRKCLRNKPRSARKLIPHRKGIASSSIWIATVTHKGCNELAESCPTEAQAKRTVVRYLREYHLYDGPDTFEAAMNWIAERDDRFDVQIVPQTGPKRDRDQGRSAGQLKRVERFIRLRGFVILTHNTDNDPTSQFEAWAYSGPLDFGTAQPIRFGLGQNPATALAALDDQLGRRST